MQASNRSSWKTVKFYDFTCSRRISLDPFCRNKLTVSLLLMHFVCQRANNTRFSSVYVTRPIKGCENRLVYIIKGDLINSISSDVCVTRKSSHNAVIHYFIRLIVVLFTK